MGHILKAVKRIGVFSNSKFDDSSPKPEKLKVLIPTHFLRTGLTQQAHDWLDWH